MKLKNQTTLLISHQNSLNTHSYNTHKTDKHSHSICYIHMWRTMRMRPKLKKIKRRRRRKTSTQNFFKRWESHSKHTYTNHKTFIHSLKNIKITHSISYVHMWRTMRPKQNSKIKKTTKTKNIHTKFLSDMRVSLNTHLYQSQDKCTLIIATFSHNIIFLFINMKNDERPNVPFEKNIKKTSNSLTLL